MNFSALTYNTVLLGCNFLTSLPIACAICDLPQPLPPKITKGLKEGQKGLSAVVTQTLQEGKKIAAEKLEEGKNKATAAATSKVNELVKKASSDDGRRRKRKSGSKKKSKKRRKSSKTQKRRKSSKTKKSKKSRKRRSN